jgi:hypothetical protein
VMAGPLLPVHMAAALRPFAACGSYAAAERHTRDRAAVTCGACLDELAAREGKMTCGACLDKLAAREGRAGEEESAGSRS